MRHIQTFSDSGDVQTALYEQTLLNPYVALVSGSLDYNSIKAGPECYIEDSDGNIYLPTGRTEEGGIIDYNFDFQADVDATWTLYHMGNVVTAGSGTITWFQDCNGQATSVEQMSVDGAPIANIAPSTPISYDEPIQHITYANLEYGDGAYSFHANIAIPYCGEDPSSSSSAS